MVPVSKNSTRVARRITKKIMNPKIIKPKVSSDFHPLIPKPAPYISIAFMQKLKKKHDDSRKLISQMT